VHQKAVRRDRLVLDRARGVGDETDANSSKRAVDRLIVSDIV
jgi:hypothetical protein